MADEIGLGIDDLGDFREVGSGGFATVYAAWDAGFSRWVAVKVLHGLDDDGRRRFDRERGFMGRLSEHPNVITPFRFGHTTSGAAYLVMEYVEGGSLQDLIDRDGSVPWERAVDQILPIADALGHGHQIGILHRDVKPANILLTARGVTKLTDFGIGVVREATATQIAFTLAHAPPETFADGFDRRDERSDLYSLASSLYALASGRSPFQIDGQDSQAAHMRRIEQHPIPTLGLGAGPDGFLARAMAKNPADRPASAAEFMSELGQARNRFEPPAGVASAPTLLVGQGDTIRTDEPPTFRPQEPAGISQPRRSVSRKGPLYVLGAIVIAGLAAVGGLLLTRGGPDDIATGETIQAGDDQGDGEDGQVAPGVDDQAPDEEAPAATDDVTDEPPAFDGVVPVPVGDSAGATSIQDLELEWSAARAAVVQRLRAGGYGIGSDGILRGPGGFEVDLSNCPAGWDDTGGVDDAVVKIGHTTAQSGNLAAYGNIGSGMDIYFDYVNSIGGIDGRQIELIVKDDGYVADRTIEVVNELLQSEDPFSITTLGTPGTLSVHDTLNANCVPNPFVISGAPSWGDPVNHPFTSGLQMSYATEARLWGSWMANNMADRLPVKVAGLVMDNDFGLGYEDAFRTWVEENPDVVSEFAVQRHDPAAPTITNEVASLVSADPEVFIAMTAGTPCLLAVQETDGQGLDARAARFTSSTCKDPGSYLAPAGPAADGWLIVGGGLKATTDATYAGEAFIAFANEQLAAAGVDTTIGLYGSGFAVYGWAHVEALRIAAELDGGLTRSNFLLAMTGLNLVHPMSLDGIRMTTNGNLDAFPLEGSEYARFDAAASVWIQEGPVVDLNGETPPCPGTALRCS